MAQLTAFGKDIKKRLVDIEQTQNWLIEEVKMRTGKYFDSSYLYKIMAGKAAPPLITQTLCQILSIEQKS